eukprot:CAMPEP_0118930760 /NCGR_PEP_ID=MMETSP1169-20130426/7338_1 /TAXON_ID=36882 /ORGANISM="Pyramimonas obovata, Strain CCMP722" /LENGTH=125 /DNA_ID=CAMNT_0006873163 /DNA_START=471 /DNA_END=845 /DNA_ORIENTATION=+
MSSLLGDSNAPRETLALPLGTSTACLPVASLAADSVARVSGGLPAGTATTCARLPDVRITAATGATSAEFVASWPRAALLGGAGPFFCACARFLASKSARFFASCLASISARLLAACWASMSARL